MTNPTFSLGIYAFANVRAFLENRATRFVGLAPQGDINRDWPWTFFGVYAQDTSAHAAAHAQRRPALRGDDDAGGQGGARLGAGRI